MKLTITQVPGGALQLAGALDIYSADALREALLVPLQARSNLALDLAGVESCDVIALQLLCSARKTAAAQGTEFHIQTTSPAMAEAAAAVGLSEFSVNPTR